MSVAWPSVRAAISAFVESSGVVGPAHVVWDREASQVVFHESSVELGISGEQSIGFDDVEEIEVRPGVYSPRITGIREFTVTFRFRARTPSDSYNARSALETLRASFHHPARLSILSDAGVSFLSTEMLETREVTFGDRFEIIAVLDVRMSVVSTFFEESPTTAAAHLTAVSVSENGGLPFSVPE
jgi:hypothetical protein